MVFAVRLHTDAFELLWPDTVAWVDESGDEISFRTGPNPALTKPMIERLAMPAILSAIGRKLAPTVVFRNRDDLTSAS